MADPRPDAVEPPLQEAQERLYEALQMIYGDTVDRDALDVVARRALKGQVDIEVKGDLL